MITLVTQGSMWPIRKRDDGEGNGEQVVMKGGGGWGQEIWVTTFHCFFHSGSLLALSCGGNKYSYTLLATSVSLHVPG